MSSKVNVKARIERHSRVFKNNLWNVHPFRALYYRFNYNIVIGLVLVLFPLYPIFAWVIEWNPSDYDKYRWDIDESTILDFYQWTDESGGYNVSSNQYFLSVNSIKQNPSDISNYSDVIEYSVKYWDTITSIATKFNLSNNTIYWANDLTSKSYIKPWQVLKISPVDWLIHKIDEKDTIDSISKKYNVSKDLILKQNMLAEESTFEEWEYLIIPWAVKKVPVVKKTVTKTQTYKAPTYKNTYTPTYVEWDYQLVKKKIQNRFYRGNCTRWVAQYKAVDWRWNAKDWYANAKAKWHPVGQTPTPWSIVVLFGKWYNTRYGHVWIVTWVRSDHLIISDMNYRRLWEVTVRKIDINDPAITWYIYVD